MMWNEPLKGPSHSSGVNRFATELWNDLLALSGPAYSVCLLQTQVKDMIVDNCGQLVLYQRQRVLESNFYRDRTVVRA